METSIVTLSRLRTPQSIEKKENVTVKGDFLDNEHEKNNQENELILADDEEAF